MAAMKEQHKAELKWGRERRNKMAERLRAQNDEIRELKQRLQKRLTRKLIKKWSVVNHLWLNYNFNYSFWFWIVTVKSTLQNPVILAHKCHLTKRYGEKLYSCLGSVCLAALGSKIIMRDFWWGVCPFLYKCAKQTKMKIITDHLINHLSEVVFGWCWLKEQTSSSLWRWF